MGLAGYLAKRLLLSVPVLLGTTFITFIIARVAVPDPARAWAGIKATASSLAAITARYHLNAPLYVQYFYYMRGLVTGDWGISPTTGRPVLSDIEFFFPSTIELALVAFLITVILGIGLGVIAASLYNTKVDHVIKVLYLSGYSSPPFFVAISLLYVMGFDHIRISLRTERNPEIVDRVVKAVSKLGKRSGPPRYHFMRVRGQQCYLEILDLSGSRL